MRELARAVRERATAGFPSSDTDAYRLFHGAADGDGRAFVDVYGRWLVAELYAEEDSAWEQQWLDALAELPFAGVYLKRRPREAGVVGDAERQLRAPTHAVRGQDAPEEFGVKQHGVEYRVRLAEGLATGLYLDQARNRVRMRELASGARVLNLFSYSCAFGVAAALGGAAQTCNVDIARGVLEWGKRNYAANGVALDGHLFWARDVLEVLSKQARRGEHYDIVVLDPPSFARGKKRALRIERDYPQLVASAADLVTPGGWLLASCNLRTLSEAGFQGWLREGCPERAGRPEVVPLAADFPSMQPAPPHLKTAWIPL